MKNFRWVLTIIILSLSFAGFSQAEDPAKVLKLSSVESNLDDYMKERKWKKLDGGEDEEGDKYYLYRKKSFGGGFVYIAAYPDKFVHYQKFDSDKHDYSIILTYDDFVHTPEGKTHDNTSMENPNSLIKNVTFLDHNNNKNENKFYGIIPKPETENSSNDGEE